MSQHTYELKFTIESAYEGEDANLDAVLGPDSATREDIIKSDIEKRIKKACNEIRGVVGVSFDSLTET